MPVRRLPLEVMQACRRGSCWIRCVNGCGGLDILRAPRKPTPAGSGASSWQMECIIRVIGVRWGVECFLTALAVDANASASIQNQALAALLFLYR